MLRHFGKLVVASTISLCCLPAAAQTGDGGSVSGSGQVILRPKATALRVQLCVTVHGDDMQATLKRLDGKGEELRKALLKAKADPKSIKLEGPRLISPLRALGDLIPVQQQYWGKGKANQQPFPQNQYPPPPQQPKPQFPPRQLPPVEIKRGPRITLQAHLRAEWPLHAETTPELLVEADRIVLQAHKALQPFLPEERPSQMQPFKAQAPAPFDQEEPDEVGEGPPTWVSCPQYIFVGRVAAEKVRQAQLEAFEKAVAQAKAVATIAGYRIGFLQTLSTSHTGGLGGDDDPFAPLGPTFAPPIMPGIGMSTPSSSSTTGDGGQDDPVEVASVEPSNLRLCVQVSATFRLLEPVLPGKGNP